MGALINVANAINMLILAIGTLYGIEKVRQMIKGALGRLEFRDTVLHKSGGYREIIVSNPSKFISLTFFNGTAAGTWALGPTP
jgi:hypothetical protein